MEKKQTSFNITHQDLVPPRIPRSSGSRFTALEMDDENVEREPSMHEQVFPTVEIEDAVTNIMSGKSETNLAFDKEFNQYSNETNMEMQCNDPSNSTYKQESSLFKSKNIVERFVRSKGKGKDKPSGALEPISVGIGKAQKSRKINIQGERSKALMIVDVSSKSPCNQILQQGDVGDFILKNKPPDDISSDRRLNMGELNVLHEGSSSINNNDVNHKVNDPNGGVNGSAN